MHNVCAAALEECLQQTCEEEVAFAMCLLTGPVVLEAASFQKQNFAKYLIIVTNSLNAGIP